MSEQGVELENSKKQEKTSGKNIQEDFDIFYEAPTNGVWHKDVSEVDDPSKYVVKDGVAYKSYGDMKWAEMDRLARSFYSSFCSEEETIDSPKKR